MSKPPHIGVPGGRTDKGELGERRDAENKYCFTLGKFYLCRAFKGGQECAQYLHYEKSTPAERPKRGRGRDQQLQETQKGKTFHTAIKDKKFRSQGGGDHTKRDD